MNILVIAKLSAGKLFAKLKPIADNSNVKKIYILRDNPCEIALDKVVFIPLNYKTTRFRHIKKTWKAIKFIKSNSIHLILSYHLVPHGYIAWIVSKITKTPWICSIIAGHREIWVNGFVMTKLNLLILKRASLVTLMGEKTKQYLINHKIKIEKLVVINNAIDKRIFYLKPEIQKKYDIIYIGRIDKNKNLPLLINAINQIKKQFSNVRVGIAGDGEEKDSMLNLINKLSLHNHIEYLGNVSHEKVCDLLNTAKIFVLTSRGEGMPMALVEAMFCGLVCISTNVGEIEEIIQDKHNGFLLSSPDDIEGLVNIISELLNNPDLLNQIALNAQTVVNRYSAENVTASWNEAMQKVCKE
ncbi:MAG: glycosyltransferase [Bacteroidales bacterium]|jgi:glycosyltransferase involved in cell wall biosynthesis